MPRLDLGSRPGARLQDSAVAVVFARSLIPWRLARGSLRSRYFWLERPSPYPGREHTQPCRNHYVNNLVAISPTSCTPRAQERRLKNYIRTGLAAATSASIGRKRDSDFLERWWAL